MIGGEALSVEHVRRGKARLEGTRLINGYGPTEGTTFSCCYEIGKVEEEERSIAIGKAIENTQLYILDRKGEVVGIGVIGEMYIGGDGLARGYMKRGEMTAERFVPDEWSEEGGGRLYRTGDLVRRREGGEIEFVGRRDEQVKVRGYRIEMGEIETVMREEEGVREAVVICREEERGEKRLVGYVVWEEGREGEIEEIRERLREKLPDYMVPREIVEIERVPLTGNGKVDKGRLPDGRKERKERGSDWKEAQSAEEEIVRGIYEEVLRIEGVGIEEDFFEIGGHSLLATQVTSRIRESLGVEVALREVFEEPTVRGLAGRIEERRREGGGRKEEEIKKAKREEEMPLSFAQQRLWFIDQFEPNSSFYNVPAALRLSGRLNQDALERSFGEIIKRHESFRTIFQAQNGRPVQIILPYSSYNLYQVDLSFLPEEEREREVKRLAGQEAHQPFDLARGPLFRITLLRLADQEHVLLLTMHHIISDGWSVIVLVHELATLYRSILSGESSTLPELPIQYADFAIWQREWLKGEELERQLSYWRDQLADAPSALELPTDRPRPSVQTFSGACEMLITPKELSEGLRRLSRQQGVTIFMTLLAAFQTLLHRYTGQEDLCVGTPIANRNRVEIEGLIGFFANTLVMRGDLSGNPTFLNLLNSTREAALEAYAHQDLPFEKLVEALQPERELSHSPLFQVMFAVQTGSAGFLNLEGLSLEYVEVETSTVKYDLTVTLRDAGIGLLMAFEYNADLFEETTIRRMLSHFQNLLQAVVADPRSLISRLPILSQPERLHLISDCNLTNSPYPRNLAIHSLFEAQVLATPDAVALCFQLHQLSYHQLNDRANQLANFLSLQGISLEDKVGVCLDRSLEVVISVLAILKAGAVYLPLDQSYPYERLSYMMRDGDVKLVLTQEQIKERVPEVGARVVCIDSQWEEIAASSTDNPGLEVGAENLAYITYTSGSTGEPKGVEVKHRGVTRLVRGVEYVRLGAETSIAHLAPLAFDASTLEIWGGLLNGGRCVVMKPGAVSSREIREAIEEEGVKTMWLTSSFYNAVMDEDEEALMRVGAVIDRRGGVVGRAREEREGEA